MEDGSLDAPTDSAWHFPPNAHRSASAVCSGKFPGMLLAGERVTAHFDLNLFTINQLAVTLYMNWHCCLFDFKAILTETGVKKSTASRNSNPQNSMPTTTPRSRQVTAVKKATQTLFAMQLLVTWSWRSWILFKWRTQQGCDFSVIFRVHASPVCMSEEKNKNKPRHWCGSCGLKPEEVNEVSVGHAVYIDLGRTLVFRVLSAHVSHFLPILFTDRAVNWRPGC